jgi:hypothetical protein
LIDACRGLISEPSRNWPDAIVPTHSCFTC